MEILPSSLYKFMKNMNFFVGENVMKIIWRLREINVNKVEKKF